MRYGYFFQDTQEASLSPNATSSDRVEVIKLPPTNGSPSGILPSMNASDSGGDAPLNLSLKPSSTANHTSSSLNSLSNMSANIGVDRICKYWYLILPISGKDGALSLKSSAESFVVMFFL